MAETHAKPQRVKWLPATAGELPAVFLAAGYFFCLLAAYYVLRPLRDEMGVLFGGPSRLHLLFTATFVATLVVAPLFAWLVSRYPRRVFLPTVYAIAIGCLLGFWWVGRMIGFSGWLVPAFFVFLSVFNLFVVSVFWSFLTEVFNREQGTRLFAPIAAGGTLGGLAGPLLTKWVLLAADQLSLILVSIGLLSAALVLMLLLKRLSPNHARLNSNEVIGGKVMAGLRAVLDSRYLLLIALTVFLYVQVSGILYFQQTHLVGEASTNSSVRTALFAQRDFYTNLTTFLLQFLGTSILIQWLGTAWLLLLCPLIIGALMFFFAVEPTLAILVVLQVAHRASDFAILKPVRDLLFTAVNDEDRYKAKNFIDLTVYRGGDLVSAWANAGFAQFAVPLGWIAGFGITVCLAWSAVGYAVGRRFDRTRE